ncbi:hypothetical protein ACP4OV_006399 [Aristida adscensionis]
MAPKRSTPQPPPPAASSDETVSGSGSDESEEEEEEIAHSPPPAARKAPPPPQAQESESESEEEEEEEEEEEMANHATPPAVSKNPPPPPANRAESESEEEEGEEEDDEEETDDEAPPPKPAPTQEGEGRAAKLPPSDVSKPAAPFQRIWSTDDEIRILEALAAHRREHGVLPPSDALAAALAGRLDNRGCSKDLLGSKVTTLKRRYDAAAKKGQPPSKDHDRRLFDLSKEVWGGVSPAATKGGGPRLEYSEVCERYPYLAEELKAAEAAHKGLFKRAFAKIDDDKARTVDGKIKKLRMMQMKLHLRRHDLTKEVTKVLVDLAD